MAISREFLSCDWGTSSFRLRRVDRADLRVLKEIRTADGVRSVFERGGDRERNFAEFLYAKLKEIQAGEAAPLIISGMVSSTIGWKELPYSLAPFRLDGSGLTVEKLDWAGPTWLGKTFLVSGVCTRKDIIRGEETQVIGLFAAPELENFRGAARLVLPGTHSKHLLVRNSEIIDFKTFMTGEIFEVLSKHSILRATVGADASHEAEAFAEGVAEARADEVLSGLFGARTRSVLEKKSASANASYLSGLLIGAELLRISRDESAPILIAAGEPLCGYYSAAMEILASDRIRWMSLPAETVESATVRGQAIILEKQLS